MSENSRRADPQPIAVDRFEACLPPVWPESDLRKRIALTNSRNGTAVVALDDDPTGTQTVHGVRVLTDYPVEKVAQILRCGDPALYLLTNSRSLPLEEATTLVHAIGSNLAAAASVAARPLVVVSRADSTLRGHYPAETDTLADVLTASGEAGFDALCLIPCFPEGGRVTWDDVHWVRQEGRYVPAAQTPFALDAVFGYRNSYLPAWVEEKSQGRIAAGQVLSISLATIRHHGPDAVAEALLSTREDRVVIVNAVEYRDLEVFSLGALQAISRGKRILFRSAASFVKVMAAIPDRPLLLPEDVVGQGGSSAGGLIVFGSHVPLSTLQLNALLALDDIESVELPVDRLFAEGEDQLVLERAARSLNAAIRSGRDAVLYTSREVLIGGSAAEAMTISQRCSNALIAIARAIETRPRYVLGKGGITSSDLATRALGMRSALVLGQLRPGVPVWRADSDSRWPGLGYIVFPGNVGGSGTVAEIVQSLRFDHR